MTLNRIFKVAEFVQRSLHPNDEPIRSIITESPDAVVVMWHLLPGQQIQPHVHPAGQDTWVLRSGQGDYISAVAHGKMTTMPIQAGQVVIAHVGQVHGVINTGTEPLEFVSIVAPQNAGFEPIAAL